jgi:hypothetical protein
VEWASEHVTVTPAGRGAVVAWRRGEVELPPGGLWPRGLQGGPPTFRLMAERRESAGWPGTVARPPAPWGEATLDVLGDQLLEAGYAVGHRFARRAPAEDAGWVPLLDGLDEGRIAVSWRRGVVDSLTVRPWTSWSFGRSLARHAVCVPLRRLVLGPGVHEGDAARVVMGLIAGGGLPCLERLTVQLPHSLAGPTPGLEARLRRELRELPGFAEAFPVLRGVVTEMSPEPLRL